MARHRTRTHRRKRHQRGGELAGNPASAWGWGMGTLGNGWTQFMNSLTLHPGQSAAAAQSNNIVPVNSRGGSRRYRRTHKRGGNIGAVLAQAAVPGTLFALSHTAKRRHRRKH
jgi:hypothetical protein